MHFRKSLKEGWLDWNFLAHGGLSTSFSRALTQSASGNSSFTFDLEVAGLLMKKTKVELVMMRENGEKSYLAEVSTVSQCGNIGNSNILENF